MSKPTALDRLHQLRDWLRLENPKITEAAIEHKLGLSTNYFKIREKAPIANGNKSMRAQTIDKVKEAWDSQPPSTPPLNIAWLVSGQGEMFLGPNIGDQTKGIPCYDTDFLHLADNGGKIAMQPSYYISIPAFNGRGAFCLTVTGDSMSPTICNGDKIILQPIMELSSIIYGDIYGIETNSQQHTIKRVTRAEDPDMIRLVPDNKEPRYGDYQSLPKTDIRRIFKVLGAVRTF